MRHMLKSVVFALVAASLAHEAAAEATAYGNCSEHIAAIIAEREAQNKLALDQRNRKYKTYDTRYQQGVNAELDAQFQKWLAESNSIYDEFTFLRGTPHSEAKVAQLAALNEKLDRARARHLKAQQGILLKWRTQRFEQIEGAQNAYEAAVKRNNNVAQAEIDRVRSVDCVER